MPQYLFTFGYCTPLQRRLNGQHGWDDENSYAFFIEASDEECALRRGADVAAKYVHWLFECASWVGTVPSWKADRFAYGIEHDPRGRYSEQELKNLPVIKENDPLDFARWPK